MSRNYSQPRLALAGVALLSTAILTGCLERTIQVSTTPPGAEVYLNDAYIGRTPTTTGFEFYGQYDVRVCNDGFEPISTDRNASMPLWEVPPLDLAASALPFTLRSEQRWEFEMQPSPDMNVPAEREGIIERARSLRQSIGPQ